MRYRFFLTILLFMSGGGLLNLKAQDAPPPKNYQPPKFSYCEYNGNFYYGLIPELYRKSELVFAMARLGDGETNRRLNQVRLRQFRDVLDGSGAGNVPAVLTQGDRIKGDGGIEVYQGGKMIFYLRAYRGCYLDFKCCDCNWRTPILKKGKMNRRQECP